MSLTIGLTGGICCGKSTVSKVFKEYNIPIVDADIVARQVVEPSTIGLNSVINCFGEQYLNLDGTLDRTALGTLVFNNSELMDQLNKIMAPLIRKESDKQITMLHNQGNKLVVYDAALIIEMGNANLFRPLIVVACKRETQISRLMSRNALTEQQAVARIDSQMTNVEKFQHADYIICTDQTIEETAQHTKFLIDKILKQIKE